MADWEGKYPPQPFRYAHPEWPAPPDNGYLTADHDAFSRRPLSKRRPEGHSQRPSLHRDYHSDNEAFNDFRADYPDDFEREFSDEPARTHSHNWVKKPSKQRRQSPVRVVFQEDERVRPLPPETNQFAAGQWPSERPSGRRMPSPPAPFWRQQMSSTPDVTRHSPSPPRKGKDKISVFKQVPSPPPLDRRRSGKARPSRGRAYSDFKASQESHHDFNDLLPGLKPHRHDRTGNLEVPYPMPGDFPSAPDTVAPDDSRSETGQPALGRRRWSETPASIKHSGSISRLGSFRSSSSGVLGDKVYRYTELQEMEFRLVRILPAKMSTIKCEIIHASLKNPPHYLAISYAWGDAGDTRKIQLEGTGISVAVSLYGALEVLRKKREAVLVWVDALCIDQQNRDERTQQVQLMTSIYSKADSVVVWLGPDADDSQLASQLLADVASKANIQSNISSIISSGMGKAGFAAVVALFERDYWKRLWVVQEVFNGKNIMVYCGSSNLPWDTYKAASQVFWSHKGALDHYFPGGSYHGNGGLTYSQVLAYQGPGSLPDIHSLRELGEESLLAVMRACRRKLSADARDKVFGILGLLPAEIRNEFPVDYSLSTREVYINVVDFLLSTTERLDIICESIHFPIHTSSVNLPSWVPDWSHIPETPALCNSYDFSAAGKTKANYRFLDERRNKLEISAIYLDTISAHGISVGTLCTLADYLMAFLHWRALLLAADIEVDPNLYRIEEAFAATLCLDQVPTKYNRWSDWLTACYHVFASLIVERLPRLPIDSDLRQYAKARVEIEPHQRRQFLQDHFGSKMMGRCFCLTNNGLMGMGSGFMAAGDVVVVPLGCSTPILLRPEGSKGEYRFVGDVYINGYMQSNAIEQWRRKKREVGEFVIH